MTLSFQQYIDALSQDSNLPSVAEIGRGIEREGLRVLAEGKLATTPHAKALGSALTHAHITTDYAESLMEFITPVSHSAEEAIAQLQDIQKFVLSNIGEELIWPMSMPCFVSNEDDIELAQYGSSNVGTMKTVYRQGLKNRYGSMMQVIAGIHFNFSFSKSFWGVLKALDNDNGDEQTYVSNRYFALLRNYKRFCWLIPYLYGSSPAICPSFLQARETNLPFEKSSTGYMYLPYATSLRMSDLGYTNSEQSSLSICYNDLPGYLDGVKDAISLSSEKFEKIGIKVDGEYQQLNSNVLQIENELYAPVRPKQVARSGEKPSEALAERGVEYIEVRALDVNPFSDTGISIEQVYFLDIFLTYCALADSPLLECSNQNTYEKNMDEVVVRGRDPKLLLDDSGTQKSVTQWGNELFDGMEKVAELLDKAYSTDKYQQALSNERAKINDPSLTPSAKLLNLVNEKQQSLTKCALQAASEFKEQLLARPYQVYSQAYFEQQARESLDNQASIEQSDSLSFDDFLKDYFA